jgi:hypothetical protein
MFDPERDDPRGDGAFWRRMGIVVLVTALAAFAMWPSISGFEAGPDSARTCVALRDGWHVDRTVRESQSKSRDGEGACAPESRHWLMLSGGALGLLIGAAGLAAIAHRRRTRSGRPEGRPEIAVSAGA